MRVQKSDLRRNASSAEQNRGQKIWSAIKSNVLENSIDKDKYQEGTGQREAIKYLQESCYHDIECSVANLLAALMRK